MELKKIFNDWAGRAPSSYGKKQWLLSKWDVVEGVEWPHGKIDLMIKSIKDGLRLRSSDTIADLGCGGGWLLKRLAKDVQRACGLDLSFNILKIAKKESGRRPLICGELSKLPFQCESFSRVLSYFVFINITDDAYVRKSILEIMRVLKKGGRALIGQLPDKNGSEDYDYAKDSYLAYCRGKFKLKKDTSKICLPPIHLFDRKHLTGFLKDQRIAFDIRDSFNPFYRLDEPMAVKWRFDVILKKI